MADRFISRPALLWLAAGLGIEDPENVVVIHAEADRVDVVRYRPATDAEPGRSALQRETFRVGYRAEAQRGPGYR
jgi:hypothetical protein